MWMNPLMLNWHLTRLWMLPWLTPAIWTAANAHIYQNWLAEWQQEMPPPEF